jgi:hypothetical protein
MCVLRTVAKDLREAYHSEAEADTLCALAHRDFYNSIGQLAPPLPSDIGAFHWVINQERPVWPQSGEEERAAHMRNREAWHRAKTLNMPLYDDDFGPTPAPPRYSLVITAPSVVTRLLASANRVLSGV